MKKNDLKNTKNRNYTNKKRIRFFLVAALLLGVIGTGLYIVNNKDADGTESLAATMDEVEREGDVSADSTTKAGLKDGWEAAGSSAEGILSDSFDASKPAGSPRPSGGSSEEHVYCVGSVSKIYSTAAVMRLVDEGKVRLDAPVTEYIPEFKMADPRYKDITVRMLMNHTSGIMGTSRQGMLLYGDNDSFHLDTILKTLSTQRLKAAPGEYAAYCNDGFDLLGIITERVSGISFTDYVEKYLAAPTGGSTTGTGYDYKKFDNIAPAFSAGNTRYEKNVSMSLGAGGVYATASDVARFGSAFFTGDNRLISDGLKKAMATRWNDKSVYKGQYSMDPFSDESGLGWDSVALEGYEETGIQVLGKGGDDGLNHAYLLVAPEEKISISVLTNGGSSALNGLLSHEILKTVFENKGITIPEGNNEEGIIESVTEIPANYDAYAGAYVTANNAGETIDEISFPDHKYMHVVSIGPYRSEVTDYVLTKDGSFAELAYEVEEGSIEDAKVALNPVRVLFLTDKDGTPMIAVRQNNVFPEIGNYHQQSYVGQKMEENSVSDEAKAAWQSYSGISLCQDNDIYSSENYDVAVANIVVPKDYPGYVFVVNGMGTRLMKIVDGQHAESFQTIPSSKSRDLIDVSFSEDEGGLRFRLSDGCEYISETMMPEFDESTKEIELKTGKAVWYRIGDKVKNAEIVIENRPENSAVYVYNKFGEIVYTSHIVDMTNVLPMPEGGKIVFLGETGGSISVQ